MARENVVNGCLRQSADAIIDHLVSELAIAEIGVKFSVGHDGLNLLCQDLAVIIGPSGLGLLKIALIVKPAIVGAFLDIIKQKEFVCAEMGSLGVGLNVFDDQRSFLWGNYLYNTKFFFLKAMFSAVISAMTSFIRSQSDSSCLTLSL